MVAISVHFSLLGSSKSKLVILSPGAECSGSAPVFPSSLISEHVSTEALLSAELQRQTPTGAALRRAAKAGCAPTDETIFAVVRRWFFARRSETGFKLLGFPHTVLQALVLDEWLEARGESLDACICVGGSTVSAVAAYYRERGLLLEVPPAELVLFPRS